MRTPKCACVGCNANGTVKIKTNHQVNGLWLCEHHAYSVDAYSLEINNFINKPKAHGFTFGQEFETAKTSKYARGVLIENGYTPTHDGTVDVEYKSSINNGLMAFAQLFKSIDKLMASGDIKLEGRRWGEDMSCGAHMHVGHALIDNGQFDRNNTPLTPDKEHALRNFYHSLFMPLSNVMKENADATRALYGRNFDDTTWACPITLRTRPTTHENFINLQHTHTIEFRLCKYVNAEQYMRLAKMHKEMCTAIVETFLSKYDNTSYVFNNKTYPTQREFRKATADATAKRLVVIFKKYAKKAGYEIA